jgi:hypothetical protein
MSAVQSSWDGRCARYYANEGVASNVTFEDGDAAELRAWLIGRACGTRYVSDFACGPLRRWPIREVRWAGQGHLRLHVMSAPHDAARTERFVRRDLLPLLLQTTALLPTSVDAEPLDVVFAAIRRPARSLPRRPGDPVMARNINGGVTFYGGVGGVGGVGVGGVGGVEPSRILVYRQEDACKVLVHELIHASGLDDGLMGRAASDIGLALGRRHGVVSVGPAGGAGQSTVALSEAYTESLACYLHARWWGVRRSAPGGTGGAVARMAAHAEDVARRVERHQASSGLREGTHCFSYVICRAAIWARLDAFLQRWPPGSPPGDPAAFATFVEEALAAWKGKAGGQKQRGAYSRSLRMTPLQ